MAVSCDEKQVETIAVETRSEVVRDSDAGTSRVLPVDSNSQDNNVDDSIEKPTNIAPKKSYLTACSKHTHMDYRALLGAGGAWLVGPAIKRMRERTQEELNCSIYATIKNRYKRYVELSKSDIEEILQKNIPVKPSRPRIQHLGDKVLVPLFVSSFNHSCRDSVKIMEESFSKLFTGEILPSVIDSLNKLLHQNESQIINCLYTTQEEMTKSFRLAELIELFLNEISDQNQGKVGKCDHLMELKKCNERFPSKECQEIVFIPREGQNYIATTKDHNNHIKRYILEAYNYASQATACLLNGESRLGRIAIGDASAQDGEPLAGHPIGSHDLGNSLDSAYYQINSEDNRLRPVCQYKINGRSEEKCIETPDNLDVSRTSVFLAKLLESPKLAFIGVDSKMVSIFKSEIERLCEKGELLENSKGCFSIDKIEGSEDERSLLNKHHHHHFHMSFF